MKRLLLLLFFTSLLCFSSSIHGQENLLFSYDSSGNRIRREISIAEAEAAALLLSPLSENFDSGRVVLIPEASDNTLKIEYNKYKDDSSCNYKLYDFGGRLLKESLHGSNSHLVEMQHLPQGTYLLQLIGTNEKKIWKIRKE